MSEAPSNWPPPVTRSSAFKAKECCSENTAGALLAVALVCAGCAASTGAHPPPSSVKRLEALRAPPITGPTPMSDCMSDPPTNCRLLGALMGALGFVKTTDDTHGSDSSLSSVAVSAGASNTSPSLLASVSMDW